MGNMSGTCQTISLKGAIEKTRCSYSPSSGSVTSVKFYKGGLVKSYGTLLSTYKEWEYSETQLLMGLHGRVKGETIK